MRADREGPQAVPPVGVADLERLVRERTEALERERDRAEAASQAKSRFLANMSHELRTPLNAVIGAAQLLESLSQSPGTDPAQALQLTRLIRSSGENLLGIINDILDLSRIEAGALRLSQEAFDLVDCIESAVETVAVRSREKGLELACIIDPDLPLTLLGDPVHLRQVLVNVLGNAVKFTAQGEVVLQARPCDGTRWPGGAVQAGVRITVRDTGIGIAPTARHRIFEAFGQVDDTAARSHGGTGLGLTISREMVRAMGGQIDFDSTPGQGTAFHIDLPLLTVPQGQQGELLPAVTVQAAIFEPHGPSRTGMQAQLQRLGLQPCLFGVTRGDGSGDDLATLVRQASDWVRQLPPSCRPLVLVRLDGSGAAGQAQTLVRTLRQWRGDAQVLGLIGSADARAHTPVGYGVSQVLLKPLSTALLRHLMDAVPAVASPGGAVPLPPPARFDRLPTVPEVPRELLARLSAQIRASSPPGVEALVSPPGSPESAIAMPERPSVLLVEDDAVNQLIARTMLEELGLQVRVADTAAQALQGLREHTFDLVIMDCQMPGMDGLEATRRIRGGQAGEPARQVPIIALTANAFSDDRQACFAAGMSDFLGKPLLREALRETVRRWVRVAESADGPTV